MRDRDPFITLGYWPKKRSFVSVPLFYIPKNPVKEESLEVHKGILLDGEEFKPAPARKSDLQGKIKIKESIVPRNWSLKKIKDFCRLNDIDLFFATGYSSPEITCRRKQITRRVDRLFTF